jgi:hypothetical protein
VLFCESQCGQILEYFQSNVLIFFLLLVIGNLDQRIQRALLARDTWGAEGNKFLILNILVWISGKFKYLVGNIIRNLNFSNPKKCLSSLMEVAPQYPALESFSC